MLGLLVVETASPILRNKAVKMRGRRRGSLLALTALLMSVGCRETTTNGPAMTVFVVRHAEYADDGSDNPGLSEIGFNRARQLEHTLSQVKIDAVYATQFLRTQQTASPTATSRGLEIRHYDADEVDSLVATIQADEARNILIAAHGDTAPEIIKGFGVRPDPAIEFARFDDLFIIETARPPRSRVTHLKYGEPRRRPRAN